MRFIVRRILLIIPLLLVVSFLTMLLVELIPGDPAYSVLGDNARPEQVEQINHQLGLDKSLVVRYVNWIGDALQGDLNTSLRSHQAVSTIITERLPVTLELAIVALLMALLVSVPAGLYMGLRAGSRIDRLMEAGIGAVIGTPSFVLALVLSYVFAVRYHLFPVTGWSPISEGLGDNVRSVFLPALTIALIEIGQWVRLIRADTIGTLQENYILAARAKGIRTRNIMLRHVLKPSMFTVITLVGLSFGRVIGGAVIVEFLFALPGLGRVTVESVVGKDFVVVQGIVLFLSVTYVVINTLIDVLYGFLDPRTRVAST